MTDTTNDELAPKHMDGEDVYKRQPDNLVSIGPETETMTIEVDRNIKNKIQHIANESPSANRETYNAAFKNYVEGIVNNSFEARSENIAKNTEQLLEMVEAMSQMLMAVIDDENEQAKEIIETFDGVVAERRHERPEHKTDRKLSTAMSILNGEVTEEEVAKKKEEADDFGIVDGVEIADRFLSVYREHDVGDALALTRMAELGGEPVRIDCNDDIKEIERLVEEYRISVLLGPSAITGDHHTMSSKRAMAAVVYARVNYIIKQSDEDSLSVDRVKEVMREVHPDRSDRQLFDRSDRDTYFDVLMEETGLLWMPHGKLATDPHSRFNETMSLGRAYNWNLRDMVSSIRGYERDEDMRQHKGLDVERSSEEINREVMMERAKVAKRLHICVVRSLNYLAYQQPADESKHEDIVDKMRLGASLIKSDVKKFGKDGDVERVEKDVHGPRVYNYDRITLLGWFEDEFEDA
ncbi:hypothetical protein GJR96_08410 [Haloferax sp. MBLA0076]|uniref:Uncharacterized protein n=1 Tax=Haloferax litoreum TaxID=2666140 RepID=A0A6A8GIL6_9EURY|nr:MULTISPECIES: hypothetical protein [Haloferax]KAB1193465.1 hypothetical protein Hfx1148_08405 [Haloferax sp. CBA1148]MRX21977.1 hypothetical protein [Haloferax litoreum]